MPEASDHLNQLQQEIRRGILVLAVLSQMDTASYGYSLIQRLAERGLEIEEGTLYPLMRRLEKQGLLASEWEVSETRPRKYYRLSPLGREVLAQLTTEWLETVAVMSRLLGSERHE
jgi:DNA-binding PadR family transcriptional regulator